MECATALILIQRIPKLVPYFLSFCLLCFLASTGISFFHIGVEQHWWTLGGGCPVMSFDDKTSEQALAELLMTPTVPCDQVAWRFLELSITVWNTALSLVMSLYVAMAMVFTIQKQKMMVLIADDKNA
jgi:disulfide bond formation protein DsbB